MLLAYKLSLFMLIFSVINFENTTILSLLPILFLLLTFALWVMNTVATGKIKINSVILSVSVFSVFAFFVKDCSTGLWNSLGLPQMPVTLMLCLVTFFLIFYAPPKTVSAEFLIKSFSYATFVLCLIVTTLLRFDLIGGLHNEAKCEILFSYGYNPNNVCVATCFSVLMLLQYRNKKWYKNYLLIFLFAFSVITGSRKVMVIYGMYFVGYAFFRSKNKIKSIAWILMGIVAAVLLMQIPVFYNLIGSRFEVTFLSIKQLIDGAVPRETRLRMIMYGLTYFRESIWFGNGWASFAEYYGSVSGQAAVYSHSNIVEMLCSSGLIGFSIYYSRFLIVAKKSIRLKDRKSGAKCFGFVLALIGNDIAAVTYYYKLYYILFAFILLFLFDLQQKESVNFKRGELS